MHADLDAFYASVEQRDDPRLRGRPVLVGMGVVTAASYEAKRCGVRCPTSVREARRLCPDAVVVPARMRAYTEASDAVFEIFRDTTPEVEGLSIDEAFLDVTGLWRLVGDGRMIASILRDRVAREVGLPLSVGVATTKFLAKVASAVAKPDGLVILRLRFGDFTNATRSHTVGEATNTTATILAPAQQLLTAVWPETRQRGLTRIGISVTGLSSGRTVQLALPLAPRDPQLLDAALDAIHDRFGRSAVRRAGGLGRRLMEVPMLPD